MRKVDQVGPVKVYWKASTREYIARIPGNPAADYFTSELADAINTAIDMDRRIKEGNP